MTISTRSFYSPPPPHASTLPAVVLQVTELVGSYMIWAGATETEMDPNDASSIERHIAHNARLASDWACAMPPISANTPPSGTSLFRTSEDLALPMAQRLARRFKKQILLSLDAPTSLGFNNPSNPAHIPLLIEKFIAKTLDQIELEAKVANTTLSS